MLQICPHLEESCQQVWSEETGSHQTLGASCWRPPEDSLGWVTPRAVVEDAEPETTFPHAILWQVEHAFQRWKIKIQVLSSSTHRDIVQSGLFEDGIYMLRKAHMLHAISEVSPVLPLKLCRLWNNSSVDVIVSFLLPPFKEYHWSHPLSTHLSFRQSVVWCPWSCVYR